MSSTRPPHAARLLVSIAAFVALSVLLTVFVVVSVLDLSSRSGREFHALVPDAAGLRPGDDVSVAGLEVGKVLSTSLAPREQVRITFSVADGTVVYDSTRTAVRYADLIGTRYLALLPPESGAPGRALPEDSTIAARLNVPAVDLTAVFDGFQPLFTALEPAEVNELTESIVAIFQGQSGTVSHLVEQVGTITTRLARRKEVISTVVTNLADLLTAVNGEHDALGDLIDGFDGVVGNLADERAVLASTIDGLAGFTQDAARLTREARPAIDAGIAGVSDASAALAENARAINDLIADIPDTVRALNRLADSGSFLKVYLCNLDLRVTGRLNLSLVPGLPAPQEPENLRLPSGVVGGSLPPGRICR